MPTINYENLLDQTALEITGQLIPFSDTRKIAIAAMKAVENQLQYNTTNKNKLSNLEYKKYYNKTCDLILVYFEISEEELTSKKSTFHLHHARCCFVYIIYKYYTNAILMDFATKFNRYHTSIRNMRKNIEKALQGYNILLLTELQRFEIYYLENINK